MGRSFLALTGTDLGFRTAGVITMSVSLAGTRHDADDRRPEYFREALARLRAMPGVQAAGGTDFLPLATFGYMGGEFDVEDGWAVDMATVVTVTPDYFRTMATPLLFGRDFRDADGREAEPLAVVNDAFAQEAGGDRTLLGKRITMRLSKTPRRIVGIVKSGRIGGPAQDASPQVFVPSGQRTPAFMTLVARVENPRAVLSVARDALQDIDPQVPVFAATTLDDHLRTVLAKPRFYTATILFLGGFAVLLSMVGIYGVSSYTIVQRRHEIGVRLAVGASVPAVRSLLMRQSLVPVAVGVVVGIPGAFGATGFLRHLLSTVPPLEGATCTVAALALALVSAATVWSAISRVLRSNPLDALRAE